MKFVLLQTNCEPANGFRSSSARHPLLSVGDDAPLKPYFFLLIENISGWKEEDEEGWPMADNIYAAAAPLD